MFVYRVCKMFPVVLATYAAWSTACRPDCPQLIENRLSVSGTSRLHLHHWMWGMAGIAYLDAYHPTDMQFARAVCLGTVLHGLTYRDAFTIVEGID